MGIGWYIVMFLAFLGVIFAFASCRCAGRYDEESDELYAALLREEELRGGKEDA